MVLHVCVFGRGLVDDESFVRELRAHCGVSLVAEQAALFHSRVLRCADALVLDSRGAAGGIEPLVRALHRQWPALPIVLVDGGLTETQKADAFTLGVKDYFPAPCLVDLLVERLEVLARDATRHAGAELGD